MPYKDKLKQRAANKRSELSFIRKNGIEAFRKRNREKQDKCKRTNRVRYLWQVARNRAIAYGIVFTIKKEDISIPEYCPVFGMKLEWGNKRQHWCSPSIDRIDNTRGYEKDNIIIVSWKANRLKSNATLEELQILLNFYKSLRRA